MAFNRSLYHLVRKLRYRTLTDLITREVYIEGIAQVPRDVKRFLNPSGSWTMGGPRNLEGMMAKYGLLDLTFTVEPGPFEGEDVLGGVSLLRELGFLPALGEPKVPDEDGLGGFCLEELAKPIASGLRYVRLYLETLGGAQDNPRRLEARLPSGYFPRLYAVVDACETNSDYVWMNKHFYL